MSMNDSVAWVRPPEPIRGVDHLGVQAPCEALYAQLLPGITNVTDRARYYSFYPWALWSFERLHTDHSIGEFRRFLRRAECLFALIAIRHAHVLGDEDDARHGAGMVGRQTLTKISKSGTIALDEYAGNEGANRYFKNKLGGLGQYYFGPLRDLQILDHSPNGKDHALGYDRERGLALAKAFAQGVPQDAFFAVFQAGSFAWENLDALAPFCPCGLSGNEVERNLLLDLFLSRSPVYRAGGGGEARRASLALILELAGRNLNQSKYSFEDLLRAAAYTRALPDGVPWEVPTKLTRARDAWGAYQRNELLSLAIQGLFAAILRAIERDRGGVISNAAEAGHVAVQLLAASDERMSQPLEQRIAQVRTGLPDHREWEKSTHEMQLAWYLLDQKDLKDGQIEHVAETSIAIILALLARGLEDYPYSDFEIDPEYFSPNEIHLLSLRTALRNQWTGLTVAEWVRWLSTHWCLERHLRVALRKLRGEQRDTFRIRPLEGHLQVVEAPTPKFTAPRIGKSVQMLRDLGLIELDDAMAVVLTSQGRHELEMACHGS